MAGSKRDALIEKALELFEREGFRATGIDRILAEARVAKMTLYHHFRSKEELVLAALRLRDERFRNSVMRRVERATAEPAEKLFALFDVLAEEVSRSEFRGCAFINACAEYADGESPIRRLAAEHKRLLAAWVLDLARAAGAPDPEMLSRQLCILMDGVIVSEQVSEEIGAVASARAAAAVLIGEQLRSRRVERDRAC